MSKRQIVNGYIVTMALNVLKRWAVKALEGKKKCLTVGRHNIGDKVLKITICCEVLPKE